jgi:hypothetical protein
MGEAERSVDRTPRDFLAAWGRGDARPVSWRRLHCLLPLPRKRRLHEPGGCKRSQRRPD